MKQLFVSHLAYTFPAAFIFHIHTGSGAHTASHPVDFGVSFPWE